MKRLTAQFGITYFTALSVAYFVSDTAVIVISALSAVLFITFMLVAKTRKTVFVPAMAAAALIACVFNLCYSYFYVYPAIDRYSGSEHSVAAVLSDEPYHAYKKYYYKLKATDIDGKPADVKILLKTPHAIDIEPDDTISFTSELKATDNDYYISKGYYLVSDTYDTVYTVEEAKSRSLYYRAIQLRGYMRESFDRLLPEDEAALCKAVFVGDKYAMDPSDRDNFKYAGASYFIVISGMHFAVLSMLLFRLFKRIRNRWITLALVLGFIVAYAAVTGFQPSVLRSGIMVTFTVIGMTVRRQTYPLNHLGIAGVVMPCIVSPYGAGDIGLILSFYATLAILLWAEPISRKICFTDEFGNILSFNVRDFVIRSVASVRNKLTKQKTKSDTSDKSEVKYLFFKKLYNAFASILSVSLAVNILIFPISVIMFREYSLVTLLSSVLLYFPIYLILVMSLFVCLMYWLGPLRYLAVLLSWPLYLLCLFVKATVRFLAGLPFAFIRIGSVYVYIWLGVTVILGAAVIALRKRYRLLPYAVLISAMVFLAGWLTNTIIDLNTLTLEAYSCGDGMYVGVNDRGRLHLLTIDCKSLPAYEITDKLLYRYGGAQTAFCGSSKELDRYVYYSNDKFAISDFLLYDKGGTDSEKTEGVTSFDTDSTFILDDDLTLSVYVGSGKPLCLLRAREKNILILPENYNLEHLPAEALSADVIIMCDTIDNTAGLSCKDLIVSSSEQTAPDIAACMSGGYDNIYYTYSGDISYNLR